MSAPTPRGYDGFDWDAGNSVKCESHGLTIQEVEEAFSGSILQIEDPAHSTLETRFRAIGRSRQGRFVLVVFTYRRSGGLTLVRPISARYMHRKEIEKYERQALPTAPQ